MSLVVASTTDDQAAVNAAAGVSAPPVITPPVESPPEEVETPENDGDSDTPDEEQTDQEDETPRRGSAYQRRIDRLTRDKYQLAGRLKELERRLNEATPPQQREQPATPAPQQYTGELKESDYPTYEAYIRAITAEQVKDLHRQIQTEQQQRAEAESRQRQMSAYWDRVKTYEANVPDFASALESVEDITVPPSLHQALVEHEQGPQLAYQLAKHRNELARIAGMPPVAGLRELGKFEAKYLNGTAESKLPASSKAPPPINPLGKGTARSAKSPDDMDFQEFKAWRLKNGAR